MSSVTSSGAAAPGRPSPRGRPALRRYVPPQHGAWAMLVLPFAAGVVCNRPVWLHLPLLVAWLAGYLLSYFALLAVKTCRPGRVAPQLRLYGAITVAAGLPVTVMRPSVLMFAPAFTVLFAVNVAAAHRRDDRALAGGLASVVQSCLMVPVAVLVSGGDITDGVAPGLVLLGYFAGAVLYVKTMIRNRGDVRYLRASVALHAATAAAMVLLAWPVAALFGWLLVRAAWFPRLHLTPKQVGLVEVANSALLLVAVPAFLV